MTSLDRRQFNRSLLAVPAAALVGTGLGALAPAAGSAAPADWNAQLVAGQADGQVMHQTRAGDGSWLASWEEVETQYAAAYFVSCAGISKDLHIVASLNSGTPDHCVRNGVDGTWTAFSPIPSLSGPVTGAPQVASTALGRELHVFAADETGSSLYHTVRREDGTWWNSWKLLRTFSGRINHIATTRVGTTIDTAVVTGGEIYHAIRASDGTWSGWGNIEGAAGEIGEVYEVALAGFGAQLQVVASNGSQVYHAIRYGDASWQRFRRITAFDPYLAFGVCAANVGGEMQVAFIDTSGTSQVVKHAIRRSDGTWTAVGTVRATGLTGSPGVLALTGTPA
jgi:hypothetical protein